MVIEKIIKIHEEEWKLYIETYGVSTRLRIILTHIERGYYFTVRHHRSSKDYSIKCDLGTKHRTGAVNTIKEVKLQILKFLTND